MNLVKKSEVPNVKQFCAWAFAAAVIAASIAPAAAAEPCRNETFEEASYTVCSFDLPSTDMRIVWKDEAGKTYGAFSDLAAALAAKGETLTFATNGGMYEDDFSPVGLLTIDGKEFAPANTKTLSPDIKPVPNFYKKPNGIFYLGAGKAGVLETKRYVAEKPAATYATQSGPLLVIGGKINSIFIPDSSDRKPRNGVGVSSPTEVHFVISDGAVNFHDFARFFHEKLGCADALFLDGGSAPALYAPGLQRDDPAGHGGFGPIIAVVGKS
jgi:uncharacterized protein YigE (DUF2233 family)